MSFLSKQLSVLLLSLGIFSQSALADVIHCGFTEPYISMKYDTATASLEVSSLGQKSVNYTHVGLEITGINTMSLAWQNAQGETRNLKMTIDYQGSDQMSDQVYPYSAFFFANEKVQKPLVGGCHSKNLKKIFTDPEA